MSASGRHSASLVAILLLAACGSGQGSEGGYCYPNGSCNVGLVCISNRCVVASDSADARGTTERSPDAAKSDARQVECGTDTAIEPNDDVAHAVQTPVRSSQSDYLLQRLAICPSTDVDIYGFDTTALGQTARIVLTYDPSQGELAMTLLARDGQPAGFDGQASGNTIMISTNRLSIARWYVQIDAAAPGVENNYDLDIRVTP